MEKISKLNEREYNKNPFDAYRCFHIGDFRVSDDIMVMKNGKRVSGTVTAVDLKNVVISYETKDGSAHNAGINDIVFLGDSRPMGTQNVGQGNKGRGGAYDRG